MHDVVCMVDWSNYKSQGFRNDLSAQQIHYKKKTLDLIFIPEMLAQKLSVCHTTKLARFSPQFTLLKKSDALALLCSCCDASLGLIYGNALVCKLKKKEVENVSVYYVH